MSTKIIGVVIAIVVIVGGVLLFTHKSNTNSNTPSVPSTSNSSSTGTSTAQVAATITFDGSGFSPADTTVKSGDTVKFTNNSSTDVQVDSDPHPVHTDDTDLNVGLISPGQSQTVTLTKKGSFGFHNHLQPAEMGHITIQ